MRPLLSAVSMAVLGAVVVSGGLIKAPGNDGSNYQITSTFEEEGRFKDFLNSVEQIDRMACFYNAMVDRDEFDYVSIGHQHIEVEGIDPSNVNYVTYGTPDSIYYGNNAADYREMGVKSMQLSREALNRVSIGHEYFKNIDFSLIDYNKELPAVFGASFKGSVQAGTVFGGGNYLSSKTWKNIGFEEPNKQVYIDTHIRRNIDNYIIFPFPLHSDRSKFSSIEEYGFVTDSMLYGRLVPNISLSLDHLNAIAKKEADKCGFSDYEIFQDYPSDDTEVHKRHINSKYLIENVIYYSISILLLVLLVFLFGKYRK